LVRPALQIPLATPLLLVNQKINFANAVTHRKTRQENPDCTLHSVHQQKKAITIRVKRAK